MNNTIDILEKQINDLNISKNDIIQALIDRGAIIENREQLKLDKIANLIRTTTFNI